MDRDKCRWAVVSTPNDTKYCCHPTDFKIFCDNTFYKKCEHYEKSPWTDLAVSTIVEDIKGVI